MKRDTNENGVDDCIELGGVEKNEDCKPNKPTCYICCNPAPEGWQPDTNDDGIPFAIEKPKIGPKSYILITDFIYEGRAKKDCGDCGDIKAIKISGRLFSLISSNVNLDPKNKIPINWGIKQNILTIKKDNSYYFLYGEVKDVKVEYMPLCQQLECKLPDGNFKKDILDDGNWEYQSRTESASNRVDWTNGIISVSPKCLADKKLSYIINYDEADFNCGDSCNDTACSVLPYMDNIQIKEEDFIAGHRVIYKTEKEIDSTNNYGRYSAYNILEPLSDVIQIDKEYVEYPEGDKPDKEKDIYIINVRVNPQYVSDKLTSALNDNLLWAVSGMPVKDINDITLDDISIEWINNVSPDEIMKQQVKHNGTWGRGLTEQLKVKGLPKKQYFHLNDFNEHITGHSWGNVDLDVGRKNISLWLSNPYTTMDLMLLGIKKYRVYFPKMSANHPEPICTGLQEGEECNMDNWFYYWGNGNNQYFDGACNFDAFDHSHWIWHDGPYEDRTAGDIMYGAAWYNDENDWAIQLNNQATMQWIYTYENNNGFRIVHNEKGIDVLETTIAHEKCHLTLQKMIKEGAVDSDNDGLPDSIENSEPWKSYGFDSNKQYSDAFEDFPINYKNGNRWKDNEIYCEYQSQGFRGKKNYDWASPGKQHPDNQY